MKDTLTAPVRIDIGGGVTDIPEIAKVIGTNVTNFAVTAYSDPTCTSPLSVKLIQDPEAKHSHIPSFYGNFLKHLSDFFEIEPDYYLLKNDLPSNTGLGTSATLSLLFTASMYKKKYPKRIEQEYIRKIISIAHNIEVNKIGIHGGIQDYIASGYGGLNNVTNINLQQDRTNVYCKRFSQNIRDYLNENMILILSKKTRVSSTTIVEDEIQRFISAPLLLIPYLTIIQQSNAVLFRLLQSNGSLDSTLYLIRDAINKSWKFQKLLSPLIQKHTVLEDIEKRISDFTFGIRGPGCGANSLFMITKNDKKNTCLRLLSNYTSEVQILFLRISNSGLHRI